MSHQNIVFIGAGAIGTSLGNSLVKNPTLDVTLVSIEEEVVSSISEQHVNQKYFPGVALNHRLKATLSTEPVHSAGFIFMAIPSVETVRYLKEHQDIIPPQAIIVNLAKGFGEHNCTIIRCLKGKIGVENNLSYLIFCISAYRGTAAVSYFKLYLSACCGLNG